MASLNKVLLIGNLTRDPELRYIPSGSAVADFGLAINRRFKRQDGTMQEEVVFVDITAWGTTAETAQKFLAKGRRVFVEGRLKLDQWTSPEGQKRSKLTVVAESMQFLDSRADQPGGEGGAGGPPQRSSRPPQPPGQRNQQPGGFVQNDDFGNHGEPQHDFGGGLDEEGPQHIPF